MHVLLEKSNPVSIECFANYSVCIVKHKEIFSKALSILFRTISMKLLINVVVFGNTLQLMIVPVGNIRFICSMNLS